MFIFAIFAIVLSSKAGAQTSWYGNGFNNGYYNYGYNNYNYGFNGYNNGYNNYNNNWGSNFGFNQNSYYPAYTPGVFYPSFHGYAQPYNYGFGGGMSFNIGFIFNK